MLNCIIIDDESPAIEVLTIHISNTPGLNLLFSSTNPIVGYNFILANSEQIDILFLDIQMDKMTGIELKKLIPADINTIFTTAYSEHALEAFDLDAFDYLMKPISYQKFIKSVNKVGKNQIKPKRDHFFVSIDKKEIKINIADVIHVEGYGNFLKIFCKISVMHMPTLTFISIEKYLKEPDFVRINKSHIVAFSSITAVDKDFIDLSYEVDGKTKVEKISIGNTYKKHFMGLMNRI